MLYALVKWLSGKEKGTYTVIDADWVMEVDIKAFDNVNEQECVVEWRVSSSQAKKKIMKQQIWELFDAVLIRTSEREDDLKKLMRELEALDCNAEEDETVERCESGGKRPRKLPQRFEHDDDNVEYTSSGPSNEISKKSSKTLQQSSAKARVQQILDRVKVREKKAATGCTQSDPPQSDLQLVQSCKPPATAQSKSDRIVELESEITELKGLLYKNIPKLVNEMSAFVATVASVKKRNDVVSLPSTPSTSSLCDIMVPMPSTPSTSSLCDIMVPMPSTPSTSSPFDKMVKMSSTPSTSRPFDKIVATNENISAGDLVPLYPGSAVTITKSAFVSARQAGTATSMARALLMAAFDLPTLLHSNLKGGPSKRPGANDNSRLQRLDEEKLNEIYAVCMDKFPGTAKGALGAAINGKLTELRLRHNKKNEAVDDAE